MTSKVNQDFFSTWNTEMAYVLGFWFADGWMTQPYEKAVIWFVSKDRDHLELVRSVMQSGHTIHQQGSNCFRLPIGSKHLWHELYSLGGRPAKSLVAVMPFIPKEHIRHFIRGFIDGDGCLSWENSVQNRRKPMIQAFGGIPFLEMLARTIENETGVGITKVKSYPNRTPAIAYSGIKAKVLAKWMYIPGDLALERKAILAQEFVRWELSKFGWRSQAITTTRMQEILEA